MDQRIEKTKNRLKNALLELLQGNDISNISVTLLCKRAHVNRNTFYSHYNHVKEVLDEMHEIHEAEIIKAIEESAPTNDFKTLLLHVCEYMYANKEFYTLVCSNGISGSYLLYMANMSNQHILSIFKHSFPSMNTDTLRFINRFTTGGTLLIIYDWCISGMKQPPEEIVEKLSAVDTFLMNTFLTLS